MRDHHNLLWAISDGSKTDMDAWKRTDTVEFFQHLTIHEERIKKKLEGYAHRP